MKKGKCNFYVQYKSPVKPELMHLFDELERPVRRLLSIVLVEIQR